ncbi:iron-siderophore ABC transporter substrate-binding protein [Vogesella indigofera]|uniref:iron-siderophore ABC transporter substrate-binding protein n=1 Tax=Vogesella indigofera TaxID=45465 RepID=UPI0035AD9D07
MARAVWTTLAAALLLWSGLAAAGVTVRDSDGVHHFARAPQRVVALSWEAAEQLLELGITPLAVADADDYRQWVVRPTLPPATLPAGGRLEPNLELLASLKPDLIIISPSLLDMRPQLARIAPVLYFDAYRHDHDNAQVARDIYLQLAGLFGRSALAQQKLAAMQQGFARLRGRLQQRFGAQLPRVDVIRFASPAVVYLYGSNSMPLHALQRLGIAGTPQPAASIWGVTQQKVVQLGQLRDSVVLYQQPFEQAGKLFGTPLWRAMPFVQRGRFAAVRATWSYGGIFSLYYLAEAMTDALLRLPHGAR